MVRISLAGCHLQLSACFVSVFWDSWRMFCIRGVDKGLPFMAPCHACLFIQNPNFSLTFTKNFSCTLQHRLVVHSPKLDANKVPISLSSLIEQISLAGCHRHFLCTWPHMKCLRITSSAASFLPCSSDISTLWRLVTRSSKLTGCVSHLACGFFIISHLRDWP